jgi:magnesium-transporting ATPase (P-type)
VTSTQLLPGDLFELPEDGKALPCDAILINGITNLLIQGTVIINESMLTGESTPIIKSHIPNSSNSFDPKVDNKFILYAGTKIVQKRAIGGNKVLAVVLSTGFNTEKGNLVRSILFPKQNDFKFQKDSIKYILFMACFTLLGFAASIPFLLKNGISITKILQRSLDLITVTVPPALPACLGIGISYAISRLKEKGISCIARERVSMAGRVNMICFDKTGTLTEDYLDIFGFRPIKFINSCFQFDNFVDKMDSIVEENYNYYRERMLNKDNGNWKINKHKDINSYFVENLATCHSLTKVNNVLMGDPIDIKMFESTNWILTENLENEENYDSLVTTFVRPGNETDLKEKLAKEGVDEDLVLKSHYEIGIVRRFEFSSKLMRMSVLVKNVNEPYFKVYTKGK